jgi:riboflavin biosynthesis pyrimidine reductase
VVFERLHPDPRSATAPELLAELRPGDHAPPDRPFVLVNMVATVDGRAAIDGRSGPIGGPADTRLFAELRTLTDAIMVGTGTLRAERYGRLVKAAERRERRAAAGLAADPVAFVLSRRLDLPWDAPLFAEPAQRVVVACGSDAPGGPPPGLGAQVELLRLRDPSPGAALRALRARHGIRSVLCEGGPTLNRRLLADGVIDELFLTVGPLLSADPEALAILGGPPLAEPARLGLRWVLRHGDELFLRYGVG